MICGCEAGVVPEANRVHHRSGQGLEREDAAGLVRLRRAQLTGHRGERKAEVADVHRRGPLDAVDDQPVTRFGPEAPRRAPPHPGAWGGPLKKPHLPARDTAVNSV